MKNNMNSDEYSNNRKGAAAMKKLTALLLAILTVITFTVPTFAAGTDYPDVMPEDAAEAVLELADRDMEVLSSAEEETLEAEAEEAADENAPVVRMYLCATAASLTGHVWLYFENLTNEEQMVGWYTLPGKDTGKGTVSVGSLRNTRTDGGGTYYNGEAIMGTGEGSVISLCRDLTSAQLATASNVIKSKNSYNLFFNNCGNFATAVWNAVTGQHLVHICFPIITMVEMMCHGGQFGKVSMRTPDISECFKQIGTGTSADSADASNHIRAAKASSFNLSCV